MTIDHNMLLDAMEQCGYQVDNEGMCYGFSHMAMQAILAKDVTTYNRRLSVIEELMNKGETILDEIDKVRKKIIDSKPQTQKEYDELLSQKEKDILSIPAFFDGVSLYYRPELFPDFFEQQVALDQHAEISMPLVASSALTLPQTTKNKEEINIEKMDTFSGAYNKKELTDYFDTLLKILHEQNLDQPLSFVLHSANHTVAMGYDPIKKSFLWTNSSAAIEVKNAEEMAGHVMDAFSTNGIAVFSTDVYGRKTDRDFILPMLEDYYNSPAFTSAHIVNEAKAKQTDSHHTSLLMIALDRDINTMVAALLKYGANPNQAGEKQTPLMMAVNKTIDDEKTVKLLLAAKADPNLVLSNGDGATALHYAVARGNLKVSQLLLDAGANPNAALPNNGPTPLCIAVEKGNLAMVELLLKAKANPNQTIGEGLTPLHYAVSMGNQQIAKLLVKQGANPNMAYSDGTTPFSLAVENGDLKMVKTLLKTTTPLLRKDRENLYSTAVKGHHQEIAALLLQYKPTTSVKPASAPEIRKFNP